jgi:hypothetical protein
LFIIKMCIYCYSINIFGAKIRVIFNPPKKNAKNLLKNDKIVKRLRREKNGSLVSE